MLLRLDTILGDSGWDCGKIVPRIPEFSFCQHLSAIV